MVDCWSRRGERGCGFGGGGVFHDCGFLRPMSFEMLKDSRKLFKDVVVGWCADVEAWGG